MSEQEEQQQTRRPPNNPFRQQTLRAWQPIPTAKSTIITFSLIGVIFFIIGIILLLYSAEIVEVVQRYDVQCGKNVTCTMELAVDDKMDKTVYFYYQLENFYQNHRRYVKSRDYEQLSGNWRSTSQLETTCDPIITNKDAEKTKSWIGNETLDPDEPAFPCGLIAKSFFNGNIFMQIHLCLKIKTAQKLKFLTRILHEKVMLSINLRILMKTIGINNERMLKMSVSQFG